MTWNKPRKVCLLNGVKSRFLHREDGVGLVLGGTSRGDLGGTTSVLSGESVCDRKEWGYSN